MRLVLALGAATAAGAVAPYLLPFPSTSVSSGPWAAHALLVSPVFTLVAVPLLWWTGTRLGWWGYLLGLVAGCVPAAFFAAACAAMGGPAPPWSFVPWATLIGGWLMTLPYGFLAGASYCEPCGRYRWRRDLGVLRLVWETGRTQDWDWEEIRVQGAAVREALRAAVADDSVPERLESLRQQGHWQASSPRVVLDCARCANCGASSLRLRTRENYGKTLREEALGELDIGLARFLPWHPRDARQAPAARSPHGAATG